jgi:hypothetical protein
LDDLLPFASILDDLEILIVSGFLDSGKHKKSPVRTLLIYRFYPLLSK